MLENNRRLQGSFTETQISIAEHPAKRNTQIGRWLGILISLALLGWVLHSFNLREAGRVLRSANYLYLVPVCALLVINFAVRALRWGVLFDDRGFPCWSELFIAMMIGYFANNILPARAGELIRAYVLGKRSGVPKSMALATVVVERVADLLVALLLLAVVLVLYPLPAWLGRAGVVVGTISLLALAFLASLNIWGSRLLNWTLRRLHYLPAGSLARIEAVGNGFVVGVRGLRNPRRALLFLSSTAVIWFLETFCVWLIAQGFALSLSFSGALFLMLAVGLGTMIPSSPGYVGTFEFFAVSALATLGVTGGRALGFTLVLHLITFLGSSTLGAICLALSGQSLMRVRKRSVHLAEE